MDVLILKWCVRVFLILFSVCSHILEQKKCHHTGKHNIGTSRGQNLQYIILLRFCT